MNPMTIFFLGVYIGACAGAIAVFWWWYRCDCREHGNQSNQRGAQR
jgi:hypothetical protein